MALGAADQAVAERTGGAGDRTDQGAAGRLARVMGIAAGGVAGRQVLAVLGVVEGFFVDGHVVVTDRFDAAVVHVDGDGRGALITVAVTQGVGESIGRARAVHAVGVAVVLGVAVGIQGQVAVGAVDLAVQAAHDRGRGVRAGAHADHATTGGRAVSTADIVCQHVAGDHAALGDRGLVGVCSRQVIDDVDVDLRVRRAAIGIGGDNFEMLGDAVGAIGIRMSVGVIQGVAVTHHTGRRVVTGDGEGRARVSATRLREAHRNAAADYRDATHSQALQTVRRIDREGAALGQRRRIRVAAVGEVFFVNRQLATFDVQSANRHRVVVVVDLQNQIRRAGIAVSILKRVGERFGPVATAMQGLEIRITGIEGVGVRAVGIEHQRAVSPDESATHHGAAIRSGGDAVGALHIVGQYAAIQGQMGF